MAFFLPWLAVGVGLSFAGWGAHQIITKNDSADEIAKKFLASLPDRITKYIERVEVTKKGLSVDFADNTPEEIKQEVKENIKRIDP